MLYWLETGNLLPKHKTIGRFFTLKYIAVLVLVLTKAPHLPRGVAALPADSGAHRACPVYLAAKINLQVCCFIHKQSVWLIQNVRIRVGLQK